MSLLEIENLRTYIQVKRRTVKAVDGVSLSVERGQTVGLVGESGSGKSVTGMSVMRLLPPGGRIVGGSIRLNGREITNLREKAMRQVRGAEVGVVFQDPMTSLNPTMTIGRQIAYPVQVHRGASKREAMRRALDVLELVGMPNPDQRLKAFPHQLSGGLRQRAMIAMALACEPRLLIADEPTTALDVTIQAQILGLLDSLRARLGMGLLIITHDMGVIAGHADRVVVMYAGQIVESADTRTLFSHMRHPYTQALIKSIPQLSTDPTQVLYSIGGRPPDLGAPPPYCRFAPRCPYVQPKCRQEQPQFGGEDALHRYACFFPINGTGRHPKVREAEGSARPVSVRGVTGDLGSGIKAHESLVMLDGVVKEFPIAGGALRRAIASVKAVSNVSLTVDRGETFGLVGESGCGKSTLGRLIVGLEQPDAGVVQFAGVDVAGARKAERRKLGREMQLMFQDSYSALDPRMRISSSLQEPLTVQRMGSRSEREARVRELLFEVGLSDRALSRYPHEFSGGQRQRVGLARALTTGPRLIVADEPVSSLDVSIRSQVLNLMKRLQRERDLTYIVISHDLSVVRYLADRVGVMYLGKLVEIGPVGDLYEHPAHPYTGALLKAIPLPDPDREASKKGVAVRGELPSAVSPPSGCRFRTRCPRAEAICATLEPPLRPFGVLGHEAACHFPLERPSPTPDLERPSLTPE